MQVRSKRPVWFLFKLMEVILSLFCCLVHWHCKNHNGVPHIFLLCGTYGGSVIVGLLAIIGSFYAEKPKMKYEGAHAGILGSFHLITVFGQMHMNTLKQFHNQKFVGFYSCSRDNSLVALYASAIYFLHLNFALDLMLSHQPNMRRHPDRGKRPLRLFFISPGVEEYVSRFGWFQHLTNQLMTSAHTSEHSNRNRNVSYDSESEDEQRVSIPQAPIETRTSAVFRRSSELKEP